MVHDDLRVEWILQRVIAGFDLYDRPECLEELLNRGDGQEEEKMIRYLNLVSEEESPSCLLFFKAIREEEIEVKIPVGKVVLCVDIPIKDIVVSPFVIGLLLSIILWQSYG